MKKRFLTIILLILCAVLNVTAQDLSERYNKQHPAVIATDNSQYLEIAKAVMDRMGIPCRIMKLNDSEAMKTFEQDQADVIITARNLGPDARASKSFISYIHLDADNLAAVRFVGKDRQLIEEIDDQFARMKQDGIIAEIQNQWAHPELKETQEESKVLHITDALLILSVLLIVASLLVVWHIHKTRQHTKEVTEMFSQAKQMRRYYAIEDNQAAHDLKQRYEAILCNPFVAIAFYDHNGQLIVENDAMKQMGSENVKADRQPLYNADGEVSDYFVAIKRPQTT